MNGLLFAGIITGSLTVVLLVSGWILLEELPGLMIVGALMFIATAFLIPFGIG